MEEDIRKLEEFRRWVRQILSKEIVTIEFAKADGTLRKLSGTTSLELIPEDKHPIKNKDYSRGTRWDERTPESQVIFDMEIGEWRSFRWDSFISLSFSVL